MVLHKKQVSVLMCASVMLTSLLLSCASIPGTTTSVNVLDGTVTHTGSDGHTIAAVGFEDFLSKAQAHVEKLTEPDSGADPVDVQNWFKAISETLKEKGRHRAPTPEPTSGAITQ